jgi:spermidine synthase
MLKKILSYLIPIKIYQAKSSINKSIEVTWAYGELVLDSKNTNYSYGSLQRILENGLKVIGYEKIRNMQHGLVLGVAGGSVVKTLVNQIHFKGKITGVEIDTEIIKVANSYFQLNEIEQLQVVTEDALEFVLQTKEKYNLIIIDIFQDTTMPIFLFKSLFTNRICRILENNGFILFNTMILNEDHNLRNKKYRLEFCNGHFKIKTISKIEQHNELIIIEKIK